MDQLLPQFFLFFFFFFFGSSARFSSTRKFNYFLILHLSVLFLSISDFSHQSTHRIAGGSLQASQTAVQASLRRIGQTLRS